MGGICVFLVRKKRFAHRSKQVPDLSQDTDTITEELAENVATVSYQLEEETSCPQPSFRTLWHKGKERHKFNRMWKLYGEVHTDTRH